MNRNINRKVNRSVVYALAAAVLFGASTPFAKRLLGDLSPVLLGGLLYLGSGLGLGLVRLVRDHGWKPSGLAGSEWPWLLGAIFFGGVLGPVALLFGLAHLSGSTASLMLNLEAVLTALIAWVVFKEQTDHRVVLGMAAIVAGGVVLSWPTGQTHATDWVGPLAVSAACVCWAIDNNLTRKVSSADALFIASSKGLIAGGVNTGLALLLGIALPNWMTVVSALSLGLLGYGISLVLFVLALRGLGTARTGAYFSTAPFIGAAIALVLFNEQTAWPFWVAAVLMGIGVWLHLTENHAHEHTHKRHVDGHAQAGITHAHSHFPDVHHRHRH